MKSIRYLQFTLLASGVLNVVLLSFFFNQWLKTPLKPEEKELPLKKWSLFSDKRSALELLKKYQEFPFEQLIRKLENEQLVEHGYRQQDLALAILVRDYAFDLDRALGGAAYEKRVWIFEEGEKEEEILVFPGLSTKDYEEIAHFAFTESWPLTPKGLFLHLKKRGVGKDLSLEDTFAVTSGFYLLEALFARGEEKVAREDLLEMILSGDWTIFADFVKQQRMSQELSPDRRRILLLDYLGRGSKESAKLLVKGDFDFTLKRLDDEHVLQILEQLDEPIPQALRYCEELLASPRSREVWEAAAGRLYGYEGESLPLPYDHMQALKRFVSAEVIQKNLTAKAPKEEAKKQEAPKAKAQDFVKAEIVKPVEQKVLELAEDDIHEDIHIVQPGDNLWRIAREYGIPLKKLREYNQLKSDAIQPGSKLRIPPLN